MIGTLSAIYNLLKSDTELVGMLAENAKWNDTSDQPSDIHRSYSIIPFGVERKMETPYIVILEGSEISVADELKSEEVYIRCYNQVNKTSVEITEILERVKVLLDKTTLDISDRVSVECRWQITLPILRDETLSRNFKESRYRLLVL